MESSFRLGGERQSADDELFGRIKNDDADALKVLFERYYPVLCRFSASIVKNNDTAEEAVANLFTDLWLKRAAIELRTGIKSYLYSAARQRSLTLLHAHTGQPDQLEINESEPADPECDGEGARLDSDADHGIDDFIDRMPPSRKLIFRMHRTEGLSYQEIADILSISVHAVQAHMVEAVKYLFRYAKLDH